MWTTKKIILIIIPLLLIGLIVGVKLKPKPVEYVTASVDQGNVRSTVEATGAVTSSQTINLNFKTVGKLQNIYVAEGDKVKAGQKLANLEIGALYSRLKEAQGTLLEAQASLEKLLAGARPEDVQITKNTVEQNRQAVASAQNALNNLKNQANTELATLKRNAVIAVQNEVVVADAAMQEIDRVLNYDDAQDSLAVLNSSSLTQAEQSQQQALKELSTFKSTYSQLATTSDEQTVLSALNKLSKLLDTVMNALSDTFVVLQNTVTTAELSQTELDSLISSITAQQTKVSAARSTLHTSQSNWLNKQAYYQEQITQAEDNLKTTQANLAIAEAQLNLKIAPPESYDIKAARARVAKAQAGLSLAQANLNDVIIYAPVDGIVTKVNYDVGEQTSLAKPVIEMIGASPLEIEVNVPESDIAKVKVGQPVEITLDAFGDDRIFQGAVTSIDPAETIIQDVVYYKIKVQFKKITAEIKPGMTANVTIIIKQRENVLRAPIRALKRLDKNSFQVQILNNNGKAENKEIQVGLIGDDYFEIISGLQENDKVITFVKTNK